MIFKLVIQFTTVL